MSFFRIQVIFIAGLLTACVDNLPSENLHAQNQVKQVEIIQLPVDVNLERETQQAVENGHQPWRLFPEQVACAVLSSRFKDIDFGNCKLERENRTMAVASTQIGAIQYRVYLERLVKSDGIWTATKIEIVKP